ncbi:MAG: hypothetical protein RR162_06120, partial [Oscillospiraceae bacterium]
MKTRLLYCILILQALTCLWLGIIPKSFMGGFPVALAFPFEQIASVLRALSLSGTVGNMAAIFLYVAISLSPLMLLILRKERKLHLEDSLIALLCACLFFVLYQMINPGEIAIGGGFVQVLPTAKAILGGTVYSILVGYFILHMLRVFLTNGHKTLHRWLYSLLFLLNMLFVAEIFGVGASELVAAISSLALTNSGSSNLFPINYLFIFLRFAVDYIPY